MGVAGTQLNGFEGFRQCLLSGAKEAVTNRNPTYVQTLAQMLQDDTDPDEMLTRLRPLLRGDELREWQPLLETAERCRDCARAARAAVRLFNALPSDEHLQAWGVTPGEWTHYHLAKWLIEMHALLERVEQLIKQTCKRFLRRDPSRRATQDSMLAKVEKMRRAVEPMRARHAHGFGYFDAIEDQKLWEFHMVAFPDIDLVASGLAQEIQLRPRWGAMIDRMTTGTMAEIDATFDGLIAALGWRVPAAG